MNDCKEKKYLSIFEGDEKMSGSEGERVLKVRRFRFRV